MSATNLITYLNLGIYASQTEDMALTKTRRATEGGAQVVEKTSPNLGIITFP
jgi:hypothetical protein